MKRRLAGTAVLVLTAAAHAQRAAPVAVRQAMLIAEDSRATSDAELAPLMQGLTAKDPSVVLQAIRALGRFERAAFVGRVAPFLNDKRPIVRVEAAVALGQLGQDSTATAIVAAELMGAIERETDPASLGALARSLGRLPVPASESIQAALASLTRKHLRDSPPGLLVDLSRALESMVRHSAGRAAGPPLIEVLEALAAYQGQPASAELGARVRRAAVAALARVPRANTVALTRAFRDQDAEVRRVAVAWASDTAALENRKALLIQALGDHDFRVRVEAVRGWSRHFQAGDCAPVIRAVRDPSPHVALTAIDLLGRPCPASANAGDLLRSLVDSVAGSQRGDVGTIANWHRGARAMVALARVAPNRVRDVLSRAGVSQTWQVRMYGAVAAGIVGDPDRLRERLDDENDNVRQAAIEGLMRVRGHSADTLLLTQLARPDYQLIQTAAGALAGTPNRAAVVAPLMQALARLTAEQRENTRDPRIAILERLEEVATAAIAPSLERYLTDYDPAVATRAATMISRWTGQPRQAKPVRLKPMPLNWTEIQRLRGARLRVTMSKAAGGGVFEVVMYPETAPATVARIVARAKARYYDGLTFHRIVTNFVIQGGSPRANEFTGDALFMRDEVDSKSHERGTLGISTRGRDTGDAQIFVNLVDNLRLDFGYTVWGRVVKGLEVVDGVMEGDQMERVEVVAGRSGETALRTPATRPRG